MQGTNWVIPPQSGSRAAESRGRWIGFERAQLSAGESKTWQQAKDPRHLVWSHRQVVRGALLECLADSTIETGLSSGRRPCGERHAKLREVILVDPPDLSTIEGQLSGYDACF